MALAGLMARWRVTLGPLALLAAIVVCGDIVLAQGHSTPASSREFTTRARQAVLMDYDTGNILFQVNGDEPRPPASMSKLMTAAVVFKALKEGQLNLDDEYLVSLNAWRRGGAPSRTSSMFVPLNTKAKISELLQGLIVQAGNDAAIALAEGMAGSEENFSRVMMEEARNIGLKRSTFLNASGLPQVGQLVTARDLAVLARYIIREYPTYFPTFSQREFNYRRHKFINRNPLLADPNVDGMQTGATAESGFGIVLTAKQEGRRLIVVLNGCSSESERRDEARKLLDYGFKSFTSYKLFDPGEVIGQARVWGGTVLYVPLVGKGEVNIMLPTARAAQQRLRAEITYASPLKPPVKKGDEVARLRVISSSSATSETPLYAAEDVEVGSLARRGLDALAHLAFGWLPR
jgi:D-alanyl-D-alanine carboxypeptidase (penicillin-binding protein 5/6)